MQFRFTGFLLSPAFIVLRRFTIKVRIILPAILAALAAASILIYTGLTNGPATLDPDAPAEVVSAAPQHPLSPYDTLSVPTYIGRYDGNWFLVDCYHDSIIFSASLDKPLSEWSVMTDSISRGHSLASDGELYLADDTENNRVLVFRKQEGGFVNTQTFDDIGNRPHHIYYHEGDKSFYCWSSQSGEMYIFSRKHGLLSSVSGLFDRFGPKGSASASGDIYLKEVRTIPELADVYVRSFTIIDDKIYFVSGTANSKILCCSLKDFSVKAEYPVPPEMAGMSQLSFINGMYYITISTDIAGDQAAATIIRCKDLTDLAAGDNIEDIYDCFASGGTPYCIYSEGDDFFLLEHRLPGVSVWKFNINPAGNAIENAELLF